jgi:hypothetical protein
MIWEAASEEREIRVKPGGKEQLPQRPTDSSLTRLLFTRQESSSGDHSTCASRHLRTFRCSSTKLVNSHTPSATEGRFTLAQVQSARGPSERDHPVLVAIARSA